MEDFLGKAFVIFMILLAGFRYYAKQFEQANPERADEIKKAAAAKLTAAIKRRLD